ncbi:MAG TPA: Ig-like domain-containing protein, partial [Acidimicrobiia bacterium]|nr:Ig-like domain-containing protein [Acidimicrobiia bacterium]
GPADGTLTLTLGAAKVLDRAGLAGPTTAASRTINFAEESNPPTAVVYTVPTSGAPVGTSYSVTVNFDEPVTGFGTSDIVLGGSSQAATPWTRELIYGQGAHYEFTLDRVAPADGTLTIQINGSGVQDLAGNAGDGSNVVTRIIDHSAPTTTTPKASLRSGTTLGDGTMRVALTWAGTDIGPSGIQSYDIQRKRDSGAYETVGSATSASFNWAVTPGHTYVFRIRARDKAGNVGAWKAGPILTAALTQQSSSAVSYAGPTTSTSFSEYSGGSQRYLAAAGASASYTTTARSLSFVTTKGPNRGSARIYIDGVLVTTVNLNTSGYTYRFVAFATTWSTAATHTIKVVSVGTPVARVDVDAFGVIR